MLNLALVGVGNWGIRYLETINTISQCKVKYLCSPHILTHPGLPAKTIKIRNYKELLRFSDIDGVIIASSSKTHFEIASFFIKNGISVLIEKPISTGLQQALRLQKIASGSTSAVMTSQVYHYHPAFNKLKQILPSIGTLHSIAFTSGKYEPRNSSSALWEWGPHDISMCLDLLKTPPIQVSAWSQKQNECGEMVFIRMVFQGDVHVTVVTGWMMPEKTRTCTVFGEEGYVTFNDCTSRKLILYDGEKKTYPQYYDISALQAQVQEFILSVKSKKNAATDISYSLRAIRVLDAAERSIRNNGKIYRL